MFNEEQIKGKWNEFKGEVLSKWGNLTDNELEESKGNIRSIAGLIQQRYGLKKEEVQEKLNHIFAKFTDKTEKIKSDLSKK